MGLLAGYVGGGEEYLRRKKLEKTLDVRRKGGLNEDIVLLRLGLSLPSKSNSGNEAAIFVRLLCRARVGFMRAAGKGRVVTKCHDRLKVQFIVCGY